MSTQETAELPPISEDFIKENKANLGQSMPKSHKPGPYTKSKKEKRRDEVYRLHFDYGYSARKISEMMKINRNTINSDIDFWYSKILDTRSHLHPEHTIIVNLSKTEQQRIRIRQYLDNCDSLQDKLAIERMLIDIDFRINNTYLKLSNTSQKKFDFILEELNRLAEEKNLKHRFHSYFQISQVTEKTQKKIEKLIAEDRHRKRLR